MKRTTFGDKVFTVFCYVFCVLLFVVTLYPFIYTLSGSFSGNIALTRGDVWLFPVDPTLEAYKAVFSDASIWTAYGNTIWYVVVGTVIGLILTILTAYPLSRRTFAGRRPISLILSFTMFFSGGIIPLYLLVQQLGLLDTRWSIVLPGAVSVWNVILMRTFFQSLPEELIEAATIDGCSEFRILLQIVLPLSMSIIAVIILYIAVAQWNGFFSALIYLRDATKYPLQLKLREVLIQYDTRNMDNNPGGALLDQQKQIGISVRHATIIVSILPIICVYPFLQKYFVKGVMVGAIKG